VDQIILPGMVTPETLLPGVVHPLEHIQYQREYANVVPLYSDRRDLLVVIWCLLPGQENESHMHPESAHAFVILEGEGTYLKGQPGAEGSLDTRVEAGDIVMIPRGQVHGIRNTGTTPMAYFAITTTAGPYKRIIDGVDIPPHG
jgi:quercetin dioxygenase-like cupin family protein